MNDTQSKTWYGNEDLADRHGSFWTSNAQWFWAGNDRSHSTDLKHPSVFRATVLAYVHYYANGSIVPVNIDATGVGEYEAVHEIKVENFMSAFGSATKVHDISGDFSVRGLTKKSSLLFPHVRNIGHVDGVVLKLRYANGGIAVGDIVVRRGSSEGEEIGRARLSNTQQWDNFKTISLPLFNLIGGDDKNLDVAFTFEGNDEDELACLDVFSIV